MDKTDQQAHLPVNSPKDITARSGNIYVHSTREGKLSNCELATFSCTPVKHEEDRRAQVDRYTYNVFEYLVLCTFIYICTFI